MMCWSGSTSSVATRNENKIAERNYAPNDNQEIKDFHPIDAESSQNQRCQHPSPHKVRIVMPAIHFVAV